MRYLCLLGVIAVGSFTSLSAQPTGISYVRGTGQMGPQVISVAPIVVFVHDKDGKAVPNSPVTWTVTQGAPALLNPQPVTTMSDANGYAMSYIPAYFVNQSQSYLLVEVDAVGVAGDPVKFLFTSLATTATLQILQPSDQLGIVINTTAGALLKSAYRVAIAATDGPQGGQGIPNIGLRASNEAYLLDGGATSPVESTIIVISPPDPTQPSAACANNTLSDAAGIASCDLQIGPRTGTAQLYMAVGEYRLMPVITLNVGFGPPAKLSILGGSGQIGKPGDRLAVPLMVQASDLGGNPTSGTPIGWAVTEGSASIASNSTVTDAKGQSSNVLTLGSTSGPVRIRAQINSTVYADFNFVAALIVSGLRAVSGDGQSVFVGAAFPNPLVVQAVDSNGVAVAGFPVAFSIKGGASLSASTVVTDALGLASVMVTAGASAGPLTVTASAFGFQVVFGSLNVLAPGPQLSAADIRNAASGQPGLTPCGLASLTGTGLAPGVVGTMHATDAGTVTLGPVDWVMIAGVQASIASVSNHNGKEKIVVQAPCGTAVGPAEVDLSVQGQIVSVIGVDVEALQPGVFSKYEDDGVSGDAAQRYVWAIHGDGSLVSVTSPAARGEVIRIFATGLGPLVAAATPDSHVQDLLTSLVLGIDDAGVPAANSGYLTRRPGMYFVEVAIPADLVTGATSATFVIAAQPVNADVIYSNTVTIPIR